MPSIDLDGALAALSLEEKVRLLTGATSFTTHPVEHIGLRAVTMSDGPIGIRGVADPGPVAAQLPNPSAVAATWDLDLVARLGGLVADEAHRLGVDVVLAPVVNLQRTPVGGRHFETYSEDPLFTSQVMATFVGSIQARGVAACVKHYIGNESETERTTYVARIDERTLREAYLPPFEVAAKDVGAWSIMAAYNQVDAGGMVAQATDHGYLINDVLKGEWAYDGVVISDWLATKTTVESANGGLDLVMPGPDGPWGRSLLAAVESGLVPMRVVDDKVLRLLRLADRVGRLGTAPAPNADACPAPDSPETRALLRETVARSIVVLQNRGGLLPLDPPAVRSIALIGPNAVEPFVQGGGSAFVNAPYASMPADALAEAFPGATIVVERGAAGRRFAHPVEPSIVHTPEGEPGYELILLSAGGEPVERRVVPASEAWNRGLPTSAESVRITAVVTLDQPGKHRVEVGLVGVYRAWVDGELVAASDRFADANVILDSSANHPEGPSVVVEVAEVSGYESRTVEIVVEAQVVDAGAYSRFARFELRHDPVGDDPETEMRRAIDAARAADVAVVIVGTNEEVESEGWDRPDLRLPGLQNELVTRVAEANPHTVVVVNAGAPVILPWLDDVAAALWWWLPGQEAGNGLADALTGRTEPSGRLPWTLPAREDDVPVPDGLPARLPDGIGVVTYDESVHVGYRGWDRSGRTPARPFGFGLGYTNFAIDAVLPRAWEHDQLPVDVDVVNLGRRRGRVVVQAYLEAVHDDGDRPRRWLAGFAALDVEAGRTATTTVRIARRSFEVWDSDTHSWRLPPGEYVVRLAEHARDEGVTATIAL